MPIVVSSAHSLATKLSELGRPVLLAGRTEPLPPAPVHSFRCIRAHANDVIGRAALSHICDHLCSVRCPPSIKGVLSVELLAEALMRS